MSSVQEQRKDLISTLFPKGISKIWCPPLSHYNNDGTLNIEKMKMHLNKMHPDVNSFLMPGSTGDGWELTFEEYKAFLKFIFEDLHPDKEFNILIGILRTEMEEMKKNLDFAVSYLESLGLKIQANNYEQSRFKGFVICPPKGKNLTQSEIQDSMESIISLGYPMVIYQLPQITENEMSPELVNTLSTKYPNVYMVKDSSGMDNIAKAKYDYNGLILLRGAETNYSSHLKKSGGQYDGFLLSTANNFSQELAQLVKLVDEGKQSEADRISAQITECVNGAFELVATLSFGNAFTNANKLLDHLMSYGKAWRDYNPPRLHSGDFLPMELIAEMEKLLLKTDLMPSKGYMLQ